MQRAKHFFNQSGKPALSVLLMALVLLLNAMAASEPLHKLIHHDANEAGHECGATLFTHGQVDSATVDVPIIVATASIETASLIIFSVPGMAIENLPPGRAPPAGISSQA